jgi:hypothetical protein
VHELKPTYLGAQEQLYGIGDNANEIFFILEGQVKLYVDMLDFIED